MRYFTKFPVFFCIAVVILAVSACNFWRDESQNANWQPPKIKSAIPFSITEPETFSADILIKFAGSERRLFFAKAGENSLTVFDKGTENELALLKAGKTILYSTERKIYAETADGEMAENFLQITEDLLNIKVDSEFESLEPENGLNRFVSRAADSTSILYTDAVSGLPVKQEFFSGREIAVQPDLVVEYSNTVTSIAEDTFKVPENFKKVAPAEILKRTK